MSYSINEIQASQEIFYYLLEHHELGSSDAPELYKAYTDSENVQFLVRSQGNFAQALIDRYDDVIYLIPDEENYFLGFSKAALRQQICKSNSSEEDYFLAIFAILVLILQFYDGLGASCKIRDYIKFGELQNSIGDYLKKGAERYPTEDEQNESGLLFTAMSHSYESLRSEDKEKLSRKKTTKEGFLYGIIRFLQDQGLVTYIDQDEMIKTTRKFDHFMDWNLLDTNNFDRVFSTLDSLNHEDVQEVLNREDMQEDLNSENEREDADSMGGEDRLNS